MFVRAKRPLGIRGDAVSHWQRGAALSVGRLASAFAPEETKGAGMGYEERHAPKNLFPIPGLPVELA